MFPSCKRNCEKCTGLVFFLQKWEHFCREPLIYDPRDIKEIQKNYLFHIFIQFITVLVKALMLIFLYKNVLFKLYILVLVEVGDLISSPNYNKNIEITFKDSTKARRY